MEKPQRCWLQNEREQLMVKMEKKKKNVEENSARVLGPAVQNQELPKGRIISGMFI